MNQMSDKDDIFSTPESEARLDLIKHLIENSELVPLVRGMPGIGKSLLASRLQSGAPDNWVVCLFEADSMMQPERLLEHVARCNGLPDAKEDNIRRLVDRFEMMRKRGNVPVLLIDEAQQLPPTSLITLLRLFERQIGGGPLLSLVLFADEQIDMLLSTPQLQIMSPQSIQVIDLPPLTREEADSYMGFILKQEGLDQSLQLDASRMSRLYRETGGAPGPLGSAIREAVGELEGDGSGGGFKIRGPLLWAGLPLVALVVLLLLFQGPINRLFSPEPEQPDGPLVAETRHASPEPPASEPVTQSEPPPILLPPPGQVEQAPVALKETVDASPEEESPVVESAVTQAKTETGAGTVTVPASGAPLAAVSEAAPATLPADPLSEPVPLPPAEAGQPAAPPPAQPMPAPAQAVSEVAQPKAQEPPVPTESAPVTELTPPAVTPAAASEAPSGLLKSADWLDQQPEGGYTLQLLAVGNIASVQSMVSQYNLQDQAFSIRGERRGQPWYPLLWGVYPDREAALAALKRLPATLQKNGAWARSLGSLRP